MQTINVTNTSDVLAAAALSHSRAVTVNFTQDVMDLPAIGWGDGPDLIFSCATGKKFGWSTPNYWVDQRKNGFEFGNRPLVGFTRVTVEGCNMGGSMCKVNGNVGRVIVTNSSFKDIGSNTPVQPGNPPITSGTVWSTEVFGGSHGGSTVWQIGDSSAPVRNRFESCSMGEYTGIVYVEGDVRFTFNDVIDCGNVVRVGGAKSLRFSGNTVQMARVAWPSNGLNATNPTFPIFYDPSCIVCCQGNTVSGPVLYWHYYAPAAGSTIDSNDLRGVTWSNVNSICRVDQPTCTKADWQRLGFDIRSSQWSI